MQTVYVVFISSSYVTGSLIRCFTGWEYNHVALALDPALPELHAYARCNYYEPLNGGYQRETPSRYLYDGRDGKIKICSCQVSDAHYARICQALRDYQAHCAETSYNFADIVFFPLRRHVPLHRVHTCISFLSEVLEMDGYQTLRQMEYNLRDRILYEGSIRAWVGEAFADEADYFARRGRVRVCRDTARKHLRLMRDVALLGASACLTLLLG